jgi:hypothetical protein
MPVDNLNRKNDSIPPYDMCSDPMMNQDMYQPVMNPSMQYEQMYMYYRYLTQQMEYKIKCKEWDRLSQKS